MLRHGMKYVDKGMELYQAQQRQIRNLQRKAAQPGLQIVETPTA
jgi:hypothetical protein